MSADIRWLAETIPMGTGLALDLGGGKGIIQTLVERKGWRYINLDLHPNQSPSSVCGDAHALPFKDSMFSLVIAKDALGHFENPWKAIDEVHRVLTLGGILIIWVPFMWPFHGDDFYRCSPLALEKLLKGFKIVRFDSPLWVFSVIALGLEEFAKRLKVGFLGHSIRQLAWRLDRLFQHQGNKIRSFAAAYLVIAIKEAQR